MTDFTVDPDSRDVENDKNAITLKCGKCKYQKIPTKDKPEKVRLWIDRHCFPHVKCAQIYVGDDVWKAILEADKELWK